MGVDDDLHRAVGAEYQKAGRIGSAGNVREPLQGGSVAPVQIFQHQDQGVCSGQHLKGLGQLPDHAGGGHRLGAVGRGLALFRGQQRGQVNKPTRGMVA